MVNKRPEKTGKSFENNIEAQLVNQGYKKVKAKDFNELSQESSDKIYASQFLLGENIYNGRQIVDFIISRQNAEPLVIQAKWQQSKGSVDEKFPFLIINLKEKNPFQSLVVIDGGGYRSDVSKTGKNILSTSLFSKRRDILSGTPIPHSIYDIVSQFEFLYPNCGLGSEIKNSDVPGKKIQPLFTRTVKSELRLREITPNEAVRVPMSLTQAALYELIVNKYRAIYKQSNLKTLEKIQKAPIRQIWCSVDPHGLVTQVLSKGYDELNENLKPAEVKLFDEILDGGRVSNKMQEALNKAESILKKGEQVIIWSQFSNVIKTLSKELGEILNIDSELLTLYGETEDASKNIELFNKKNNEFKVLVANPKKGGEGISLHKNCWNAIYVDRSYDCAKYLQSRDRIHRVLGPNDIAPENVNYYIFESWHPREFDLIDRRISSNLKRKLEVMIEVLNDKELIPLSLGEDDIGELENAGLIGMEEINDYIDDLELEYENLKKNSILDEYLDSL